MLCNLVITFFIDTIESTTWTVLPSPTLQTSSTMYTTTSGSWTPTGRIVTTLSPIPGANSTEGKINNFFSHVYN